MNINNFISELELNSSEIGRDWSLFSSLWNKILLYFIKNVYLVRLYSHLLFPLFNTYFCNNFISHFMQDRFASSFFIFGLIFAFLNNKIFLTFFLVSSFSQDNILTNVGTYNNNNIILIIFYYYYSMQMCYVFFHLSHLC